MGVSLLEPGVAFSPLITVRPDPLLHFFRITTITCSGASFVLGVVPLLVLQKLYIARMFTYLCTPPRYR